LAASAEQRLLPVACCPALAIEKMALSRTKGRDGWQTCPVDLLWQMLREHVDKGDPVDVANLAMMIHHRSAGGT